MEVEHLILVRWLLLLLYVFLICHYKHLLIVLLVLIFSGQVRISGLRSCWWFLCTWIRLLEILTASYGSLDGRAREVDLAHWSGRVHAFLPKTMMSSFFEFGRVTLSDIIGIFAEKEQGKLAMSLSHTVLLSLVMDLWRRHRVDVSFSLQWLDMHFWWTHLGYLVVVVLVV